MADLTSEQKELIVVRLACYADATEIQAEFKERFDFKPSLSQISYYNPLGAQGSRELKQEWKDLFWTARKAHDETVLKQMPFTNQDYRMHLIQRVVSDPVMGRSKTGAKFYEMGCKDLGGLYTNTRKVETPSAAQTGPTLNLTLLSSAELTELQTLVDKATVAAGDSGGAEPPLSG